MGRAETTPRLRVLVVEDDVRVRFGMAAVMRAAGHEVLEVATCMDAVQVFRASEPHVVVTDLRLPDGSAIDLLPKLVATRPDVPVCIVTGYGTIDIAVAAVKLGAADFLTKPVDMDRLLAWVRRASAAAPRRASVPADPRRLPPFGSAAMRQLEEQVNRMQQADCSVLILGETGTGKSVLARRIHDIGARAGGPFVDVNCAGLTREFVDSELFGHERGAFTGAHAQKVGLFEMASGGTLFLDEIGDIDLQVQPKVLKVLEEKRFRRMGDVRERVADVRLIAATHHDLFAAAAKGTFRSDLFYRINTVTLTVSPLRERPEDILPLSQAILAARTGEDAVTLAPDACQRLLDYHWPGNIRELKNVLERALIMRSGSVLRAADVHLDGEITNPSIATRRTPTSSSKWLAVNASGATRDEIEREHISLALEAENGRVEAAAKRLGMPRSTLYQRLKAYGITVSRARSGRDDGRDDKASGDDEA